jgi:hypothetical protein
MRGCAPLTHATNLDKASRTERRALPLVTSVIALSLPMNSVEGADRPPAVQVQLRPAIVRLHQQATIAVSGINARALEVRLSGATDLAGRSLPWRPLRLVGRTWLGTLPAPALRGIYPIELRTSPRATPLHLSSFLRVFERGTSARPSFAAPVDVARWWVRTVRHAKLVALRPWPRPAFDQRDIRLHRLFVVAYNPLGRTSLRDRLGIFVTAVRDGYHGHWRLLEPTIQP